MALRFWDRPGVGGSPALCLGQDVAKVWTIEDAGVLSLEPVIVSSERFDVETLPRPGQTMLSHHRDL